MCETGALLNLTTKARRLDLNALSCVARVFVRMARSLLLMTAILLTTAPLTQHIWSWDHFLRGGQDFEFGSLAILLALCLVFLLVQSCKQRVVTLLTASHLYLFLCYDRILAGTARSKRTAAWRCERISSPVLGAYNLLLQI
jgi:hypothetical protein